MKPNLIDSLMTYEMQVTLDNLPMNVKITVKNLEPIRIEPSVKSNEDLMRFMRLTIDDKKYINSILNEHIDTFRNIV